MTLANDGAAPAKSTASSLVIAGRLMLLLLAAVAVVSSLVLSRGHDGAVETFGGPYACSMHPQVTSTAPGECPVCRMALERVSASRRGAAAGDLADRRSPAHHGPGVEPASRPFPDSAERPNYKLVAGVGRRAFAGEARAPAWVAADGSVAALCYRHQLAGLAPGVRGRFHRAAAPAAGVEVRRTAEPPSRWDSSTSRFAFRVAPGAPALEPGDVGWVELAARATDLLTVPVSAVLVSQEGPYVLVVSPDGRTFTRRTLEIGQVIAGHAVVDSGLGPGERVVVGNAFFLEAEWRLSERTDLAGVTE